jgi:hypothetical protein
MSAYRSSKAANGSGDAAVGGLRQFDSPAEILLGWNKFGPLALISAYCFWLLWSAHSGPGLFATEIQTQPELDEALGSVAAMDCLCRRIAMTLRH